VLQVLTDPEAKQNLDVAGSDPETSTPEEFSAFIRREAERWDRSCEASASTTTDAAGDALTHGPAR